MGCGGERGVGWAGVGAWAVCLSARVARGPGASWGSAKRAAAPVYATTPQPPLWLLTPHAGPSPHHPRPAPRPPPGARSVSYVHGDTPPKDRRALLAAFQAGELSVLINVMVGLKPRLNP